MFSTSLNLKGLLNILFEIIQNKIDPTMLHTAATQISFNEYVNIKFNIHLLLYNILL